MSISTPVAFLIFNRPELTQRVFQAIAKAKPKTLLVVADGPRSPDESEKCRKARAIIDQVDWDCRVLTNFSEQNLGCRYRISSGLNWVFSEVEEAIILEDDCLPSESFFQFCETLLDHYRHDQRIMHINGCNFQSGISRTHYSYYFSKYPHIWGWATWRRAWQYYDVEMSSWPEYADAGMIESVFETPAEQTYWKTILAKTFKAEIDTWDYSWGYAFWSQHGLSITPDVNLVSNIGFGEDATHSKLASPLANLDRYDIWGIKHPPFVVVHREADSFTFCQAFSNDSFFDVYQELTETREELKQQKQELRQARQRISKIREQLEEHSANLRDAYETILAMRSSKFWQFRTQWLKLKRRLNLTSEYPEPPLLLQLTSKSVSGNPGFESFPEPSKISSYSTKEVPSASPIAETQLSHHPLEAATATPYRSVHTAESVETVFSTLSAENESHLNYLHAKVKNFTLVGDERVRNIYTLSKRIEQEKIPGDVIECGVCNGGTAAILAHFATNSGEFDRLAWLFDSFEGMPVTTEEDGDEAVKHIGKEVGDLQRVRTVLNLVNSDMTKVKILKGWFNDTFPTVTIPKIALLNIDADWYSSVKLCLDTFYDSVVPGGFISFDDYGHWQGCRTAVDEFFKERQLTYTLHEVDYTARWIQKL